jgi:hypothetical protein
LTKRGRNYEEGAEDAESAEKRTPHPAVSLDLVWEVSGDKRRIEIQEGRRYKLKTPDADEHR